MWAADEEADSELGNSGVEHGFAVAVRAVEPFLHGALDGGGGAAGGEVLAGVLVRVSGGSHAVPGGHAFGIGVAEVSAGSHVFGVEACGAAEVGIHGEGRDGGHVAACALLAGGAEGVDGFEDLHFQGGPIGVPIIGS